MVFCKDRQGLALIDLLIALGIFSVITLAAMGAYVSQQEGYTTERMIASLINEGRTTIAHIAKRIRLARAGVDPNSALVAACQCRIELLGNHSNISTFLTSDHAASGSILAVYSTTGFQVGDSISLSDSTTWRTHTITSIGSGTPLTLTITPPLDVSFPKGSYIHRSQRTTFALDLTDPTNYKVTQSGTSLAQYISGADGFQLRYFDGADTEILPSAGTTCLTRCLVASSLPAVRKVSIQLTVRTPRPTNRITNMPSILTFHTYGRLRNPSP